MTLPAGEATKSWNLLGQAVEGILAARLEAAVKRAGLGEGMALWPWLSTFMWPYAGGITRDVLLGRFPAGSLSDWRYLAVSVLAAVVVFLWYPDIDRRRRLVLYFDAAGLALFAVTGTLAALSAGLSPVMAPVMGMTTGIGGGILRDVLVNETPAVLRSELYAIAALAGGLVVVAGHLLSWPWLATAVLGAGLCFFLRMMAIHRGWGLPTAPWPGAHGDGRHGDG